MEESQWRKAAMLAAYPSCEESSAGLPFEKSSHQIETMTMASDEQTSSVWKRMGDLIIADTVKDAPMTIKLMTAALGMQEDNIKLLQRIDANIGHMMRAPLATGRDFLNAALVVTDVAKRQLYIEDARRKFTEAANLNDGVLGAQARFLAGVCFHILGDSRNAQHSYHKSFDEAYFAMQQIDKVRDRIIARNLGLLLVSFTFVATPFAVAYGKMKEKEDDIIEKNFWTLSEFLDFVRHVLIAVYPDCPSLTKPPPSELWQNMNWDMRMQLNSVTE